MSMLKNDTCPHCKLPLREYHDYATCSQCETSYHEKCWEENGGCTLCDVIARSPDGTPDITTSWYLYHDNKNHGPLTWEQLCSHPGIQPDDLVWNSRLPNWIRADQVPNLSLAGGSPGKREDEDKTEKHVETGKGGISPGTGEHSAGTPASANGSPQWKLGGAGYRFSPKPVSEPDPGERDRAIPEAGVQPPATPAPSDSTPQWKLGGARGKLETSVVELPGGNAGKPPPSSRTEQIIDNLYQDQPPGPTTGPSFLDRQEDSFDEEAETARSYSRHMVYGIFLVLGGLAAATSTYYYAVKWETLCYAAAGGAILIGVIDFFHGLFGRLKYR